MSEALLYVVRHGETDWNRQGRYQGQSGISHLTATGRRQAEAVARALSRPSIRRIVSSPLQRCVKTAEPLGARLCLPVETDARTIEISHGSWEGRLRSQVDPALLQRWQNEPATVAFPGGETLRDVERRWAAFAATLDGKNDTVVITHDVLVRLAILTATDRPLSRFWEPRVVNGGYARFSRDRDRWRLLDECCDEHLDGLLVDAGAQAL